MKTFIFVLVFGLTAASISANEPTFLTGEEEVKEVTFHRIIPIRSSDRDLFTLNRPDILGLTHKSDELEVMQACGLPINDLAVKGAPVAVITLGPLIKAGIRLLFGSIDKHLKKELEKHSAKYSASTWLDHENISDLQCFRFVRGVSSPKGDVVLTDMIFAVRASSSSLGAIVYPLRVYYGKPAPKRNSSNDEYGFAVSMTTANVTEEGTKTSVEALILKDKFTLPKKKEGQAEDEYDAVVKYYKGVKGKYCKDADQIDAHPLSCITQPTGTYVAITKPFDGRFIPVGVTVSVAEAGKPDKYLSAFSKLFSEAQKNMAAGLGDLAVAKLGLKPDS